MARKYSSTAVETTLSGSISSVATSITVGSVTGWPTSPSVSATYTIIIDPDTVDEEVCEVTGASGTVLTIVRGVDGSTAKSHNIGAVVKHGVSARDFADSQNHIDATTAHGATGGVVGETKTQTLTNKTINAASNTITNLADASIAAGAAIAASKIAGTAVVDSDARLTDTRTPTDGSVTTAKIADGNVTTAKIADGNVTNVKLANSSVTIGGATATLGGSNVTSLTGMVLDSTSTIGGVSGTKIAAWTGAWTSYTPTVSGFAGTVTATASGLYHYVNEKTIVARVAVTFSAFATPGTSTITVSLPIASTSSGYTAGLTVIGTGLCDLAGSSPPNPYMAVPTWNSTTTFSVLFNNPSTSVTTRWTGDQPSGQASTDRWSFLVCYEVA